MLGAAEKTPYCKFFSIHLPHKAQALSESTKRPNDFPVIIAGVHQAFDIEKKMLHFLCLADSIGAESRGLPPGTFFALPGPSLPPWHLDLITNI